MKKKIKVVVSATILFLALGSLFVYLGSDSSIKTEINDGKVNNKVTLNVGSIPSMDVAVLEIAKQEGYFKEQGLEVNIEYTEDPNHLLAALSSGELDASIATLAAGTFTYLLKAEGKIKIIADISRRRPEVIIRADLKDKIAMIEDLKNRKIATPRESSISSYHLYRILSNSSIAIKDIASKPLKTKEAITALHVKNIEGGIIYEPFGTLAIEQGAGVFMTDPRIGNSFPAEGYETAVLLAGGRLAEDKELLDKFIRAYRKAAEFYNKAKNGNSDERLRVIDIISNYTGIQKDLISKSKWTFIENNVAPNLIQIEDAQEYWLGQGLIKNKIDLEIVVIQ